VEGQFDSTVSPFRVQAHAQVITEKIAGAIEAPLPVLTPRDARLPDIKGKAFAVIGMRRAGKTSFLHQCRAARIAAGESPERLLYFNFEDERLADLVAGELGLIPETLFRLFPNVAGSHSAAAGTATDGTGATAPFTLFLDEIQRVAGWELFARRMLDTPGCELFLSGSSARLLSREIATSMRGRAWEIQMQPFSFREWLRHHKPQGLADLAEMPAGDVAGTAGAAGAAAGTVARLSAIKRARVDAAFARYLQTGGFPEAQSLSPVDRRQLLQGYVDVLLLRDVAERHGDTNLVALRWLTRRLLAAPAGLFSVSRFADDCKSQGVAVSRDNLHAYVAHLEDAFLLQTLPVFTASEKRRQVNPRKAYPADTALIPVFDRSGKSNTGHALETVVFNALKLRGADIGYVKTNEGFEVDFFAEHADGSRELLQVCASVDDPETLAREVRALEAAEREMFSPLPAKKSPPKKKASPAMVTATSAAPVAKRILTLESRIPFPAVPEGIEILPAWQWLLTN